MKTYCVKCRRNTENLDTKNKKKIDKLCSQNAKFVELKCQDLRKGKKKKVY